MYSLLKLCTDLDKDNNSALNAFHQLLTIVGELRARCPWDQEQTLESLRHLTIEEAFELSEAILAKSTEDIKKELGDLLLHIILYAHIATEQHLFTVAQVIQALCAKLIYRHPHIYGQEKAEDTQAVQKNWEKLKLKEKGNSSVLGGVPQTLPSLIKAIRIQEKAQRIGLDWHNTKAEVEKKLQVVIQTLVYQPSQNTPNEQSLEDTFGDVLFTLVHYATLCNVNAEKALEKANRKFIGRFQHIEQRIVKQGKQITQLSAEELMSYWEDTE